MLPLFRQTSSNPMMVYHGMYITKTVTAYLNPGQTPIMESDQPLYQTAKKNSAKVSC